MVVSGHRRPHGRLAQGRADGGPGRRRRPPGRAAGDDTEDVAPSGDTRQCGGPAPPRHRSPGAGPRPVDRHRHRSRTPARPGTHRAPARPPSGVFRQSLAESARAPHHRRWHPQGRPLATSPSTCRGELVAGHTDEFPVPSGARITRSGTPADRGTCSRVDAAAAAVAHGPSRPGGQVKMKKGTDDVAGVDRTSSGLVERYRPSCRRIW